MKNLAAAILCAAVVAAPQLFFQYSVPARGWGILACSAQLWATVGLFVLAAVMRMRAAREGGPLAEPSVEEKTQAHGQAV